MLRKLTSPFREFGLPAGIVYLIDQSLLKISSRLRLYLYELMIQPIPDEPLLPERMTRNLEFREIGPRDPDIAKVVVPDEIVTFRFEQEAICLGIYRRHELIGYIWFSFGTYLEDEVRCMFVLHPKDASVFDFDLYLLPEHRMGLGFVSVWHCANRYLRDRGVAYTFSRVSRFNTASRRAHAHLGCKCVGRCLFLKLWTAELMFATVFPYIHLSVSGNNRVRLDMRPDALLREGKQVTELQGKNR